MSVLDVEAASKNQQPVRSRAHVKMQDQRGLIQLCKAGLAFENQSTELTTSTEQGKTYNQLKRCRKTLDKVQDLVLIKNITSSKVGNTI